jgi:hypothetical protein
MSCGGGHLEFSIGIKKQKLGRGPSNDHSWVVWLMFENASSLKPLGQLKPNYPGMIIGRSSTKFLFFYADRKFISEQKT